MSICFFLTQQYQKAVDKASESLKYKKTVKALYRRAKAYAMRLDYERAIKDMEEAVRLDPSDPNDI
jgi:tetratricopeptide (TPR) repeat protein